MANFSQTLVFNGLGTLAVSSPIAGPLLIRGKVNLPQLPTGSTAPSAVVVTITQNGPTVYTGLAGAEGFMAQLTVAIGDALTFVFSSAAAVDQPLNVIKSTIALSGGM